MKIGGLSRPAGLIFQPRGLQRYKRLSGFSSVQFGLVAPLGRRPPMTVVRLAEVAGMDKGRSAGRWPGWSPASWFPGRSTPG
jgi:hypothetical protein